MNLKPRPRMAILISGRGSNMHALLAARDKIPADMALALSDQPDAAGLGVAKDMGVPTAVVARQAGMDQKRHEAAMLHALKAAGVTHLALAGFMRLLSAEFLGHFSATLNIHPSLLPAFKGLQTHARALAAGVEFHGCSVHLVDAGMDTGPVLAQASIRVHPEETAESLASRVLVLEHALYPIAVRDFLLTK